MAKKTDRAVAHFDPEGRTFEYCIVDATRLLETSEEPAWFREYLGQGKHLEQRYGLPSRSLLILALTLHLFLQAKPAPPRKQFRSRLKSERSRFEKAREGLQALRRIPLAPLQPVCTERWPRPDGGIVFESTPDPVEEMVQATDKFLNRLNKCAIPPDPGGRRISRLAYVIGRLQTIIKQHNPSLKLSERVALCAELFDPVRNRHGHRSKSPNADCDEMPRYEDLLGGRGRGKRATGYKTA